MLHAIQWDPSVGIELGFITLRYYSLMFLIAFGSGFYITKKIYKNESIPEEKLDSLFMYVVIGTLLGARLGHVIFYQAELFTQDPLSVFLPFSFVPEFEFTGFQGLASHGATIGIFISAYLYSKKILKKHVFWILDRIVLPVSFGAIFVRIGNFMNSEIIGKPTNSDFGVVFVQLGEDFARHPSQLYESACYAILFVLLSVLYWKTNIRKKLGMLFGLFFVILWIIRFVVEYSKEPQVAERADWLFNTGQLLSIPFIIIGLGVMYWSKKNAQKQVDQA
ncbi:prolipoprotein diacylglyceryl transferase [Psychroflexus maritimus]|uniref:Phosphatidylglycerol--prolipoprotein diacylglyceryl transferase n=1 Tax=Psychroflexus maritimus TaxID=2714865 RepID=A0A967E1V0_9FLAO|nr:prolipoprotein diacylglyceryl transferase [Psychroflexus maritimus]NGZ89149.1 prolipoprotein diacylglyceryl transferase [Psychroflexus maritimus]